MAKGVTTDDMMARRDQIDAEILRLQIERELVDEWIWISNSPTCPDIKPTPFDELMRKLVKVPKHELERALKQHVCRKTKMRSKKGPGEGPSTRPGAHPANDSDPPFRDPSHKETRPL